MEIKYIVIPFFFRTVDFILYGKSQQLYSPPFLLDILPKILTRIFVTLSYQMKDHNDTCHGLHIVNE